MKSEQSSVLSPEAQRRVTRVRKGARGLLEMQLSNGFALGGGGGKEGHYRCSDLV